ncbi:anaerobic dimethyl sulfoxide reductase subunit C [Salmonella bongori]|nr:anaerobic dimethyl sulfoxide reductase subunit C [Salmonella bongori]
MRCAVVAVALLVLMRLIMQPAWLAYINAVDTAGVTFPHRPLQMLATVARRVSSRLVRLAAGMVCFAAGGLRNVRGTLVAGGILLLIGEIVLRYVFFSIG